MGYICVNITDIEIPNDFKVYVKPDGGYNKPYPILGNTWTDYGVLAGMPIYSGGTTEIWMSGSTYDFQYGTTYWVRLEEFDYPERYVIRNIRIFDAAAFGQVAPAISPTNSLSPTRSVTPSVTRTSTVTPSSTLPASPPATPSITPSISISSSITPSLSLSSSIGASQSPSPSITPTITPTNAISLINFASVADEIATMGITNPNGRTFTITFQYRLRATCDNIFSSGQNPNQARTYLYMSTGATLSWFEVDSVEVSVPGGTYPIYDDEIEDTGDLFFTISGITDINNIKIYGSYDCAWNVDGKGGDVEVIIHSVSVNTGDAAVVCDNRYYAECLSPTVIDCLGVLSSPSPTPTVTPTITPSVSTSPELIEIQIDSEADHGVDITDVRVDNISLQDYILSAEEFPIQTGGSLLCRSPRGTGKWTVRISLLRRYIDLYGTHIELVDGAGYPHCGNVEVELETGSIYFYNVDFNMTENIQITFRNSGSCPPPASKTPSVTPTISKTPSVTGTPGRSITPTPTTSPALFSYYVDIFACNGSSCDANPMGYAKIVNNIQLTVGYYYKYQQDYVFRISSTSITLDGDVTDIYSTGYDNCNDACSFG